MAKKTHIGQILDIKDGKPGDDGKKGDSVVMFFKRAWKKPAKPSAGIINPSGWSKTLGKRNQYITNVHQEGTWVLQSDSYYKSYPIQDGESTKAKFYFRTEMPNATVIIDLKVSSELNSDKLYLSPVDSSLSSDRSNSVKSMSGSVTDTYEKIIATPGKHFFEAEYVKDGSNSASSDAAYIKIDSTIQKIWLTSANVINGVVGVYNEPFVYSDDTVNEEFIFCLSETHAAPLITDSANVDGYIPANTDANHYKGTHNPEISYHEYESVKSGDKFYISLNNVPKGTDIDNDEYWEEMISWTDNISGVSATYPYEFRASRKRGANGTWGAWTTPKVYLHFGKDGANGEDGADGHSPYIGPDGHWYVWEGDGFAKKEKALGTQGATPYPQGYWMESESYTRDFKTAPYVQFNSDYYLLNKEGTFTGAENPNPQTDYAANGSNATWVKFDHFKYFFTEILLANFAKIGSAVFAGDKLISQQGIDGSNDYTSYTDGSGAWQPNTLINFLNGYAHFCKKKVVFAPDGSAKIGIFEIEKEGHVIIYDKDNSSLERVKFTNKKLPSLKDLRSAVNPQSASYNATAANFSGMSGTVTIQNGTSNTDNFRIEVDNSNLYFDVTIKSTTLSEYPNARFRIKRYKNNILEDTSMWLSLPVRRDSIFFVNSEQLDVGNYKYEFEFEDNQGADTWTISLSQVTWRVNGDVRATIFGRNGFTFFSNKNNNINHLYLDEDEGLQIGGKTDIPGVLLSGVVSAGGGFAKVWGAKQHSDYTAVRNGAGVYTVYHSIGHKDYSVQITPQAHRSYYISAQLDDFFVVYFYTADGTPTFSDCVFNFAVFGRNY